MQLRLTRLFVTRSGRRRPTPSTPARATSLWWHSPPCALAQCAVSTLSCPVGAVLIPGARRLGPHISRLGRPALGAGGLVCGGVPCTGICCGGVAGEGS